MRDSTNAPLLIVLAAGALILLVAGLTYAPPDVAEASVPQDRFSAERAVRHLEYLIGDDLPHPAGSPQNEVVRQRIAELFRQFGYETVEHPTEVPMRGGEMLPLVNLLVRIKGTGDGPALMLTCHHDSVPYGPGAGDDGAAVATLLELASMLSQQPPLANDLILLMTDGEEGGMRGARQFVAEHPWAQDVGVVINLEGRGSSGPSMMFETSEGNWPLIQVVVRYLPYPRTSSLFYEIYKLMPNNTDFTVFKEAGMAGLNFAFIGDVRNYHTADDDLEHLDPRSLQHHGENAWALVKALGNRDLNELRGDDNSVYFDILGRWVVAWPARFTLSLAAFAAALSFVGLSRLLIEQPPEHIHPTFWSFPLGCLAAAAAPAVVLLALPQSLLAGGWPTQWVALQLALASASLLALLGCAWLIPSRCEMAVVTGTWVAFSLVALAAAALLPGSAYFFIVPLLIGGAISTAMGRTRWLRIVATSWTIAFLAMVLPVERLFYDGLGFTERGMLAARFGLLGSAIFPMLVMATPRCRLAVAAICAITFAAGLTIAALV